MLAWDHDLCQAGAGAFRTFACQRIEIATMRPAGITSIDGPNEEESLAGPAVTVVVNRAANLIEAAARR